MTASPLLIWLVSLVGTEAPYRMTAADLTTVRFGGPGGVTGLMVNPWRKKA
jgi:hypothetical protein